MPKSYVLDTSAVFTFTNSEEGSRTVEKLFKDARRRKAVLYMSFVSFMELYYITWQVKGERLAKEFLVLMESLPVEKVHSSDRLTLSAGRIKATHKLSLADAFVAATAIEKKAVLVHKDPELEVISKYVPTIELPYKQGSN